MTERYNGWTNYATWRIHLEIFDGMEFEDKMHSDYCEELAYEIVLGDSDKPSLKDDYATAFLDMVDWREIAHNVNEYNGHGDPVLISK